MHDEVIAVLADIHGNIWALDAVLDDLDRRGVTTVVDLGDSLNGPLDPAATADRLIARGIPSLCGNDDRVLLAPPLTRSATLEFALGQLRPEHFGWLRVLPQTRTIGDDMLLCHGTPRSDETYLLEAPSAEGTRLLETVAIEALLGDDVQEHVVCCGHSHIPRAVALSGGRLAINPGSVGYPAYAMDFPMPYVMESGTPHAKYALLSRGGDRWSVAHIQVPYDWEHAAAVARQRGRPDCAFALSTGRASRG
jgi:predicted phosphodiesterase